MEPAIQGSDTIQQRITVAIVMSGQGVFIRKKILSSPGQEAMRHEMCDRLYVTVLDGVFPADIYHPHIDHTLFTSIT